MKKCIIAYRHEAMGKDSENCIICGAKIGKSYKQKLKEKVASVPQETKQKFLDLMWAGKSVGEAKYECGLDLQVAGGILQENIDQHHYLRREAI